MDRANNFDLIRLFAAVEVALVHAITHLNLGDVPKFLSYLPGVPIFFLISGFLIFPSYAKSTSLWQYSLKRIFRIYPALIVCFILSVAMLLAVGYMTWGIVASPQFGIWAAAQLTILQFYNPEFMRAFGAGVINGSLWTIAVELQFYVLTPVLYRILVRHPGLWGPLIGALMLLNIAYLAFTNGEGFVSRLAMVTFLPWLYMFLVGAWLSTRLDVVKSIVRLPFVAVAAIFAVAAGATHFVGLPVGSNKVNPLMFMALAMLVIRLAYTAPWLAGRLLRGNDISYGVYIYHMPIINFLMWAGLVSSWAWGAAGLAVVVAIALASWVFIERPSLSLLWAPALQRRRPVDLGA